MSIKKDKYYIGLANNLAKNSDGFTGPNPSVGALVVKNDKVLSFGSTSSSGRPHAEVNALKKLSKKEKKNSSKIILCLGRFHRNKGIDILLKAMPYLNDYNLWIVGEGEERKFYDLIVKQHGLSEKVFFYEWTNNISEFINSADILVCPSRHEPFGNIVVDGWAHKIPVIVSDTGGPSVLINNNINGLKFKNEDFFDLITKVKSLESKKSLVKKIINNGYNEYIFQFFYKLKLSKLAGV